MYYPPRPKHLITAATLPSYEGKGYAAQVKMNGSNCQVIVNAKGYQCYNRHKELMNPQPEMAIMDLYMGTELVLNGEWLNKGVNAPKQFCIFDILRYGNYPLVGKTFMERQAILDTLFGVPNIEQAQDYYLTPIYGNIQRVVNYFESFDTLYQKVITATLAEGLVLKRIESKLEPMFNDNNNSGWQLKIRKPSNNYRA